MPDSQESADPRIAANAAASTSLRDTAKWLVGGVTATAAGVFAGSSLTRLGSLDFMEDGVRLGLAIGGVTLGFVGLGLILARAISAMTVDSVDFITLCRAERGTLARVRRQIEARYGNALPGKARNLPALLGTVLDKEFREDDASRAFMRDFEQRLPAYMAEAGFLNVREKFAGLVFALWIGGPLALVGFGIFAWAANPPEGRKAAPFLVINRP
jgi:hypothetical protein